MHSAKSATVLVLLQHLPCIGAGKLGDVVTGNETSQSLYAAIFVQRMDFGIGALVRHIFLDKQMTIGQRCNLRRVGDAQDLMPLRALTQYLADASRSLAGHAAVDLIIDHSRHSILIGHCVLDGKGDTAQLAAGCDLCQGLGCFTGVC